MGYAWTRCRRCARRLTNGHSVKNGLGPECADETLNITRPRRARLMDTIDYILEHDDNPSLLRNEATHEAARIDAGKPLRYGRTRFLTMMANRLKADLENPPT